MVALAGIYLGGEGTPRDPAAALVRASVAATQAAGATRQEAIRLQGAASVLLSDAERSAAQARAASWRPMP
jgi:hypothetical protein